MNFVPVIILFHSAGYLKKDRLNFKINISMKICTHWLSWEWVGINLIEKGDAEPAVWKGTPNHTDYSTHGTRLKAQRCKKITKNHTHMVKWWFILVVNVLSIVKQYMWALNKWMHDIPLLSFNSLIICVWVFSAILILLCN